MMRQQPAQQGSGQIRDEAIADSHRKVDAMIQAMHAPGMGTQDYADHMARAYQDLSRGLNLAGAEASLATRLAEMPEGRAKAQASARRCIDAGAHVVRAPAGGPVPGIVSSPQRHPNGQNAASPRKPQASPRKTPRNVPPPWGPERANLDKPPWEQVLKRQQNYCKILDQQTADKTDQVKRHWEQEINMDHNTSTSLESATHTWGQQPIDAVRERAIYREHLATVDHRERQKRERTEVARQDGVRIAEDADKHMAWSWHTRREEDKQEKQKMASCWKAAATQRRKMDEAAKQVALQEEQEALRRASEGMVPARRMRRPKEECIALQEAMPAARWQKQSPRR